MNASIDYSADDSEKLKISLVELLHVESRKRSRSRLNLYQSLIKTCFNQEHLVTPDELETELDNFTDLSN